MLKTKLIVFCLSLLIVFSILPMAISANEENLVEEDQAAEAMVLGEEESEEGDEEDEEGEHEEGSEEEDEDEKEGDEEDEEEYDFESMNTYELFWPITAGKLPGDKFYRLKVWRDKLVGYLFFDKVKKSEYLKQLANKRLVEAENLLTLERYPFFSETIQISGNNLERGLNLFSSAAKTERRLWLRAEYVKDLQKHLIVLGRMAGKAQEEQKEIIEAAIERVNQLAENYKIED